MDNSKLSSDYLPLLRQYWLPLILAALGLIFLGYSLIGFFSQKQDQPDILFEAASTSSIDNQATTPEKLIAVDVEGAVQNPGVYKLPPDSRIQDALIAARGLAKDADRALIARNLNLASKLTDGMKIYISFLGEPPSSASQDTQGSVLGGVSNGLININSAGETELDSLPGIGKVTAEKIISSRPFNAIEELLDKKIVSQKVFDQIKDKIAAQ